MKIDSNKIILWFFILVFAALASTPWLVPHTGALALFAFVPLLLAEDFARELKIGHFWVWHYTGFVLWNAATTFWVCNATVGGGLFAIFANALQMSLIFGLFRFSRNRISGVLPYIFLAAAWIAWERWYLVSAQISWPWLVLGNAFAQSTHLVQWYDITGTLGGSLWVWAANLSVYGSIVTLSGSGSRSRSGLAGIVCYVCATILIAGPMVWSNLRYNSYEEKSDGTLPVVIGQPNIDPYNKFKAMTQSEQTARLLTQFNEAHGTSGFGSKPCLFIAPETVTSDVFLPDVDGSETIHSFKTFLKSYPGSEILFGASSYELIVQNSKPEFPVYPRGEGQWLASHNSAILTSATRPSQIRHKSKLVVGTELTPYPSFFEPLDDWICRKFGLSGPLIARCTGQNDVTTLDFRGDIPVGCAVCYESVYPEFCTQYVKAGAEVMSIITNDAWWGDTPGYRQHLSFARLRAIELRRDIARCGNTGISCFIDQRGEVLEQSSWWQAAGLSSNVNLNTGKTLFVEYGDIVGRVSTLVFLLLLVLLFASLFTKPSQSLSRRGR